MTQDNLYLDLETFNEVPIDVGTYKYAETAEPLLFAYALNDMEPKVWDCTESTFPPDLWRWLKDDDILLTAHNALFDRTIIRLSMEIETRLERWRCTMVKAYSHAFPGGLDQCGAALGLPKDQAKLADGKKLINRFCKPAPSNHKADRYDKTTHPEEWAKFVDYAARDIVAMRKVHELLPVWNWKPRDIAMWHLDQRINDRGFLVDRELCEAGAKAAVDEAERMATEFVQLTRGEVDRPTQRNKFMGFLNENYDLGLDNTRAETFREILLEDDIDPNARRLMEISVMSNKTSTAKYATLLPAISSDGRFRGGLQFRGAARTRRWSGRTFQPQNLPSRGIPKQHRIDAYVKALKQGIHEILFDDLMNYGSAALRAVVIAPEGQLLSVADLSNIEGRANAWLAGERWKLKAFTDYDRGDGHDLYKITAGDILGQDPGDVSEADRNVFGKVPELALGYEAGFGGLQTFAKGYGVSFSEHWDTIQANTDPQHVASARANYTRWGQEKNPEADQLEWIATETVKLAWRAKHPKIVQLWKGCKQAAKLAIQNPGKIFTAGPYLKFSVRRFGNKSYLLNRLPSGAFLCYCEPRYHEDGDAITYMGIDSTATGGQFGKWQRLYTYGGKFVENSCQSLSLDIMCSNMETIDKAGFPIILTVHDEIVAEPTDGGTGEELAELMSQKEEWLRDFPLAAAGFSAPTYRK